MDLDINIADYDLVAPTAIDTISAKEQRFVDIDVEDDHTFFFKVGDKYVLSHNCDASHILGIYMGWYLRFAPHLFNERKVAILRTPYVVLWADNKMSKIHKAFYNLDDFRAYEKDNNISKYKKNLFKGLGSWSKEQFQQLFDSSENGLQDFLQYISLDEAGKILANSWLSIELADERKNHLRTYSLDIDKI